MFFFFFAFIYLFYILHIYFCDIFLVINCFFYLIHFAYNFLASSLFLWLALFLLFFFFFFLSTFNFNKIVYSLDVKDKDERCPETRHRLPATQASDTVEHCFGIKVVLYIYIHIITYLLTFVFKPKPYYTYIHTI